MWISLSFHLGHWFDSFSTVGLRNSPRANKKGWGRQRDFTCSFLGWRRESWERGRVAWEGHDFPGLAAEEISVNKGGRDWFFFCWHESQEEVRPGYFSAVRTASFIGTRIEEYGLYGLLYGALNFCTNFEECTVWFSCCTVHLFLAQNSRKVRLS